MTCFRSFVIVAALGMSIGCGQQPEANSARNATPAPAATPQPAATTETDLMAQGRKLYMDNCAACHKEDGKGGKVTIEGKTISPEDLTEEKMKNAPDDKLYRYIFNGIEDEGMPAFKDKLSEAEIREVVRFLRVEVQKMTLPAARKPTQQ